MTEGADRDSGCSIVVDGDPPKCKELDAIERIIDIVIVSDNDLNEQMYCNGVVCNHTNGDTVYTTDINLAMISNNSSLVRFKVVQIEHVHENDWPKKLEEAIAEQKQW